MRLHAVALAVLMAAIPASARGDELPSQLKKFLTAPGSAARSVARKTILATPGLTHERLESEMAALDLWSDPPPENPLHLDLGEQVRVSLEVHVALPSGYTHQRAWPLVIGLHGQNGHAADILRDFQSLLGDRAKEFILAAPQDIDGPLFSGALDAEMRPRQLLLALRKIYRIDNDRVFITGYSLGGHRTWMTAVWHNDCFAGAMPMAGCLAMVPGGDALFPDVLGNLRNLPVLCVWGENDLGVQDGQPQPGTGIAGSNARMTRVARALDLDKLTPVMLRGVGHLGARPPAARFAEWIENRRVHFPRRVRQAFRLPELSHAYWLRVTGLQGDPLPDVTTGKVKVTVGPDEDPQVALSRYYRKTIGWVEANVSGQAIDLRTQKSKYVELDLHDDLLNLDQPIKVTRNKSTAFDGTVTRDLGLTLDEAQKTWDFQRLPRARLLVPVGGKAKIYHSR